jgi:2-haloacid dehalogenase
MTMPMPAATAPHFPCPPSCATTEAAQNGKAIVTDGSIAGVVFDLGGVVIDWNPRYVYRDIFAGDEAKMETFLTKICPQSWNEKQDAGRSLEAGTRERVALFPAWEREIRAFYDRWIEMIGEPIPKTAELMDELKALGLPLYALSNWSAELFPLVRRKVPAFALFDRIFLSGEYRMIKPDPRFFEAVLAEIPLPRERLVFIDDSPANVAGGQAVGLRSLHFTGAETLRGQLRALGVRV